MRTETFIGQEPLTAASLSLVSRHPGSDPFAGGGPKRGSGTPTCTFGLVKRLDYQDRSPVVVEDVRTQLVPEQPAHGS